MSLAIGDLIDGKYQITDLLGEGGMGTVYEALHRRIQRRVAVKVLKPGFANDPSTVRRFEREAQAAGRIGSAHIVEIFDIGEISSGERYMIMELLEGESLSQRLRGHKRLVPEVVFPLAIQLLEGLGAAHEAGIVHRDLKPANVFITSDRAGHAFVKLLDFGVSKFGFVREGEGVTHTGAIVGTPHYMAPELTKGSGRADARSDLYAVGAILYRALSGWPPHRGETIHELLVSLISEDPPPLASVVEGLDRAAALIVDRSLARNPDDRYASAAQFAAAMQSWLGARALDVEPRASFSGEPSSMASGNGALTGPTPASSAAAGGFTPASAAAPGGFTPASAGAGTGPTPASSEALLGRTPASIATPGPSELTSLGLGEPVPAAARRARIALVVGAVGVVAAALGWLAVGSGGGGQQASEPPSSTPAVVGIGSFISDIAGQVDAAAASGAEPDASASGTAPVEPSARPATKPSARHATKARPRPAAKATGGGHHRTKRHPTPRPSATRTYRTDI